MTDPLRGRAPRSRGLSPLLLLTGVLLPVFVWACDDALGVDVPERTGSGAVAVLLEPRTLELVSLGDTVVIIATLVDAAGAPVPGGSVTWASSDPAVASVAPEETHGRVTSVGNGLAVITASTSGGLAAAAVVIVAQAAARLEIAGGDPFELGWIGAAAVLEARVDDARGHPVVDAPVSWSSADPLIARVDGDRVRATGVGHTRVIAASGVVSDTVRVVVENGPGPGRPPSITTTSLPDGVESRTYGPVPLLATGDATPMTWGVRQGALPPGIVLDAASGVLSGMPTQAGVASFAVEAVDSAGRAAVQSLTLTSYTELLIGTAAALPQATRGTTYATQLLASGGTGAYAWSVDAIGLPDGLALGTTTGELDGTPSTGGSYFFTASVTSGEQIVSHVFTIEVVGPPPPFSGTIFIDPDIITDDDPTTLAALVYAGQGSRTMFDRRAGSWITVDAYLFEATFADGLHAEVQVNPEFGSRVAAEVEAEAYATAVGRLPVALLQDVETLWIHRGVYPFGGGNNNILIHTGQGEQYAMDGILEETLVHEAAHTSLDSYHASAAGWRRAQVADGTFISTYARDFPTREDVAESYLPYLAVRHRSDRISSQLAETILETMPFRIEYFDSLALEVRPIG